MGLRPVVGRDFCQHRLQMIFPAVAFDSTVGNRQAAASVATMIYVGAVVNDDGDPQPEHAWCRPSMVMSLSDQVLARDSDEDRIAWTNAALRRIKDVATLVADWGIEHQPWYATNSREGVRDQTWKFWLRYGAARRRSGVSTSSPSPRWALTASFADLFAPNLTGQALQTAIDTWRDGHLSPGEILRIRYANDLANAQHQTAVNIPGYGVRMLEPGPASAILKGVIEEWTPRRLITPIVVAISEPGAKIWTLDEARMADAGISINVSNLLPDAIILDAGTTPPTFWIVEAVATDGEINEDRKNDLLAWANRQYIDPNLCEFLSAFSSRSSPAARKRLKDIAAGTFAWFLDEPDFELAWYELSRHNQTGS
jgi:BsuBI/PstI restriction endonuclease domain/BsuBI/PstI restriction endonuclease HTH domain